MKRVHRQVTQHPGRGIGGGKLKHRVAKDYGALTVEDRVRNLSVLAGRSPLLYELVVSAVTNAGDGQRDPELWT